MKKWIVSIISLTIFTFCKNEKLPQCENISDISLGNIAKKHSKLQAQVIISNPDRAKVYTLKNITLDLHINGIESGTLVTATPKDIPAEMKVAIPVSYLLNTEDFINKDKINGQYTVEFKGNMTLKDVSTGDLVEVPIHKTEKVTVNIKKIEKQEEKAAKQLERKERKTLKKEQRH